EDTAKTPQSMEQQRVAASSKRRFIAISAQDSAHQTLAAEQGCDKNAEPRISAGNTKRALTSVRQSDPFPP
ncbi:MAG: hypothetical protein KDB29_10315, partial [Planctomycetes bacterium]|nr:hypothetical protein [Planctomycetota bacterium]